ncbi:MAG TPA: MFS transporter [candidate division Zixibacteria bacterium]|nr:MFS transporter [candidate division Zixibacteria bacterium]
MNFSAIVLYALAAICQTSGSSGAAMLAPFFMKEHGYPLALVGIPLVANGVGRVCSDLLSGFMASYFSSGALLVASMALALLTSALGYFFLDLMPVFLGAWTVFGLTEAMFALSLRKIGFDLAPAERQGRVQGQLAAALGIGFTMGPLLGGFVGNRLGPDALFLLYGTPQMLGLALVLAAGAHRYRKASRPSAAPLWQEGLGLLKSPPFIASCLAIFQCFLFLVGVTRVAFPFLALNHRGIGLEAIGAMVSISRLTDTLGRYTGGWLSDRIQAARVILMGISLGIPALALQAYGESYLALLSPLALLTLGFGFTNVGSTTLALQVAPAGAKGLGLGLSRAATSAGQMLGPLLCGWLIERAGYERGFQWMALITAFVLFASWRGLRAAGHGEPVP